MPSGTRWESTATPRRRRPVEPMTLKSAVGQARLLGAGPTPACPELDFLSLGPNASVLGKRQAQGRGASPTFDL